MSYGVKYRCQWVNWFDETHKIEILKRDYGGSATDVNCASEPIRFEFEGNSDFMFDPIWGTQLVINLVTMTNYQFLDLYTNSNREYKVIFYIDSVAKWSGFLLPDQYQEEYKDAPYVNSFIATDQLGYLRTLAWDRFYDETQQYGLATMKLSTALGHVFTKTDLELDMREGLNVYETRQDSGAGNSPLGQTYMHGLAYEGKTYYDVLYDILFKFNAVCRQRNNQWFIFRPIEAHQSFTTRLWTFTGTGFGYTSNTSTNLVKDSTTTPPDTDFADMIRIGKGTMHINPAWCKYNLVQDYVKVNSRLLNADFTKWTGGVPDDWMIHSGFIYHRNGNKIKIPAIASRNRYIKIYQLIRTDVIKWDATIKYNIYVPPYSTLTVYFYTSAAGWDPEHATIETFNNIDGEKSMRREINSNVLFESAAKTGFRLLNPGLEAPVCTNTNAYIEIDQIIFEPVYEDGDDIRSYEDNNEEEVIVNNDNNYDHGDIDIITADCPVVTGFRDIYRGSLFLSTDIVGHPEDQTEQWDAPEKSGSLVDIIKNCLARMHADPRQVINVPVFSKLIDQCSVIKDMNNSDKLFLIKRATWSPKYGRWDIEAHELSATPQALIDETDTELEDETGVLYG